MIGGTALLTNMNRGMVDDGLASPSDRSSNLLDEPRGILIGLQLGPDRLGQDCRHGKVESLA